MTCRICSNARNNTTYQAREMMFGFRDRFTYFQCSGCGCLQIAEFPSDMAKYYPAGYYSFVRPEEIPRPRSVVRRLAGRARNRYAVLGRGVVGRLLHRFRPNRELRDWIGERFPGEGAKAIGLSAASRILDVGCGSGELLLMLHLAGFDSLLGVDAYIERDVVYPEGLRVLKRSIHDVAGEWDLVMFHHSFEHLPDPRETLETATRLLAGGGTCLIRLPIVDSYAWEHYGVDWVQLDAPRHFFLHSVESLTLLARHAGLEIERIVHDSTAFQFSGSELYRRDIPLQGSTPAAARARARAFTPEEMAAFQQRARELNTQGRGDQAAFYLRKVRHKC
jgi:2-polyprenyl-3-methyl-5-hydroxy-6-metoxy-1,4-benzoquinol methylase